MEHLPKKIHQNGISYTLMGDCYIPDLKLPEESRPIGRWGRMHKAFLQEHRPGQYNELLLPGKLWTYLADLNEQADDRLACIISEMLATSSAKSIEEIRSFISRQKETYRTPYEAQPKDRLRQCVFGGSSNTVVTGWKPFSNPRMFAGYGRQRG